MAHATTRGRQGEARRGQSLAAWPVACGLELAYQLVHAVGPTLERSLTEKLPVAQGVHAEACAPEKKPLSHAVHVACPF